MVKEIFGNHSSELYRFERIPFDRCIKYLCEGFILYIRKINVCCKRFGVVLYNRKDSRNFEFFRHDDSDGEFDRSRTDDEVTDTASEDDSENNHSSAATTPAPPTSNLAKPRNHGNRHHNDVRFAFPPANYQVGLNRLALALRPWFAGVRSVAVKVPLRSHPTFATDRLSSKCFVVVQLMHNVVDASFLCIHLL